MRVFRAWFVMVVLLGVIPVSSFSQMSKESEVFGFGQRLFKDGNYALAAEQFRQFLRSYPESDKAGEAQFMVGEALFAAQAHAMASSEFQDFLVRYPYHLRARDVWYRMGECYAAMGRQAEAGGAFLQFQSRFSADSRGPDALLKAAEAYLAEGDLANGRNAVSRFMSEYPKDARRWKAIFLQGRLYRLSAAGDSALAIFNEVIASGTAELVPGALFEKGQTLSAMGRYEEAIAVYAEIVRKHGQSDVADRAQYQMGLLHYRRGRFKEAILPFQNIVETTKASDWHAKSQLFLAHALRESGDFPGAVQAYEVFLAAGPDSLVDEAKYGLAISLANQGQIYEAIELLDDVQRRFQGSEYALKAGLKTGDLLLKMGHFEAAIERYRAYILGHDEMGEADQLLLTIGEIYEKNLGRHVRATDEYRRLINEYPQSPLAGDAMLAMGRCYEKTADYRRARSAYDEAIERDPKSPVALMARERLAWIDDFALVDLEGATAELLALADGTDTEDRQERIFRTAAVALDKLRDFPRTIEIMESFLTGNLQSTRTAEALQILGRAYEGLSRKTASGGPDSMAASFHQKAGQAYARLANEYPDSPWADDAALFGIQSEIEKMPETHTEALKKTIDLYGSFLARFPGSDRADEVRMDLGNAYMAAAARDGLSAYDKAMGAFEAIPEEGEQGAEANFRMGLCHQAKGEWNLALKRFDLVVEVFPSSRFSLDAQMGQAQCYTSLGQQAMAIDVCRAMVYRYPQSQLASQMRIHMGDLYAQLGDFRKAREAYEKVIERGDDIPADLHFKMAEVLRASGDVDEASEQYRCYLETDAEGEYANQAHYGLATVQEEQGRLAEAARDYQTLIEQYPASPLIPQATARLGIVQYELGQYEQARMTCQEALDLEVDEPLSIELEAKNVMASFRLGDVVTAETKARAFRKSHPQEKDLLAQFDIEKGSHYVSARNHKDARVAYENLITENPRSPYVDDAQYGIGMSYLGSEEYEKAIEAFRTLIQEHPQSDFIPSVYLKLGSIYYLQLHFEEAIFAYRKVVEAPGAGELVPLALFNLIQTFEATNRQDQALAVAEELLLRYPDFEDALRVKIKVGYLNMELGNYDQAVAILEEVLPLVGAEEETEVRYWIGESNYESGKYELALLEYLRVAYLSQTGSMWAVTAEFRAGQTYEALGKVDEAKRLYHQMIERYGSDSQWGQAARERLRGLEG